MATILDIFAQKLRDIGATPVLPGKDLQVRDLFLPTARGGAGETFRKLAIKPITEGIPALARLAQNTTPQGIATSAAQGKRPNFSTVLPDVAKSAKLVGAATIGPTGYAASAGLGAGAAALTGQDPRRGAIEGVEAGQQYGGIARFTTPLLSKFVPAGILANRAGQGAVNAVEGVAMNQITGRKTTPQSVAFDFAMGALLKPFGAKQLTLKAVENDAKKYIDPIETKYSGLSDDELFKLVDEGQINPGQLAKISQRKQGLGLLVDFENASAAKDYGLMARIGNAIKQSADDTPIAQYKDQVDGWLKAALPEDVMKLDVPAEDDLLLQLKKAQDSGNIDEEKRVTDLIRQQSADELPKDPVQKVIALLREAKPMRKEQEALYSAERAKRAGAVAGVGQNIPGEQGYFAQLGQLKGELPKIQFERIRNGLNQSDIDTLFNNVEAKQDFSPFEKVTAKTGLAKLLGAEGGTIPTEGELKLLKEVFPDEFIQAVLDKRSTMTKLFGMGENMLNLPRSVMATADLSAPLRQGAFLIGRPKQWLPAFRDMFKYAFDENAYKGLQEDIQNRDTYPLMRQSKLAITDMGEQLNSREEAFMSNIAENVPVFGNIARGSNRAYSGFLNKLRADTFDDLLNSAQETGAVALKEDGSFDNPKVIEDIANFVNTATGRGNLGALQKAAPVLNGIFFSPRLMASRLNLLNPVYYTQLDPFVRKEAIKSLLTFAGTGLTIAGLAKLGGADVGTDPRSADFGKIKTGNTRYDPWGGFQQYIVAASRLLSGEMVSSTTGQEFTLGDTGQYKPTTRLDIVQRMFESKTSPIASFILDMLRNKTTVGEDFNLPVSVVDRFIPMFVQDMYDLYRERGSQGLLVGTPAAFGIGVQTYGDQVPMNAKTATGRPTVKWRQQPSLGEDILNKFSGTEITDIPKDQQEALRTKREADQLREIALTKAKSEVLLTGKPQTVGDTYVYLDKGIVKTKKVKQNAKK